MSRRKKVSLSPSLHAKKPLFLGFDAAWASSVQKRPDPRDMFAPAVTLGLPEDMRLAQDAALAQAGVYNLISHSMELGMWGGTQFMGYAALQQISQHGLLRACIETVADDMTRNWITLGSNMTQASEEQNDDEKKQLFGRSIQALGLQKLMHKACELVGYEGGCFVFIDTGAAGEALAEPLDKSGKGAELTRGGRLRFQLVDPVNCGPGFYNSTNPLAEDYFVPQWWMVQGTRVHASRLIRMVANEPLLLLRPAYNFLGIPQAQLLWDYVLHFQENRDAANRLLNKFSLTALKTNMEATLQEAGGVQQMDARMQLLARYRNNDGVLAIDKDSEELIQVNTPLSGVRELVQQSLEHLAALNRTPAVKLLGISPSGFNATGESDIRNYYDHIASQQEKVIRPALEEIFRLLSVQLFGEPDAGMSFEFAAMSEADEAALAAAQNQRATALTALVAAQIISPDEARKYLRDMPGEAFSFLTPEEEDEEDPYSIEPEEEPTEKIEELDIHA